MRFREHRGQFDDSMATMVELQDKADLVGYCNKLLNPYGVVVKDEHVEVERYHDGKDDRLPSWDVHIVTIKGYGVMGFTDGPARTSTDFGAC